MTEAINSVNEQPTSNSAAKNRIRLAVSVSLVIAALGFAYWLLFMRNRVSTDDAYARADSAQISSRVPGTVLRVLVENDYWVDTGRALIELDPADYKVAADRARAAHEQNQADLRAAEISLSAIDMSTSAQVQAAEAALEAAIDTERQAGHNMDQFKSNRTAASADLAQVQRDSERFENLYSTGAGTRRQSEQAHTALNKNKAQIGAIEAQISASQAGAAAATQQVGRARAQLQAAQSERYNVEIQRQKIESLKALRDKSAAELEAARLNLSYCTVSAPIPGYIAQKSIQAGDRVQPGQALMAVVPLQSVYVEANCKETQLTYVRIGQPATIKADIYPGYSYSGKVTGIRAGTGAAFSLIPAENATGNWIKVVQRIPVRIELDPAPPADHPLRVGASLDVTIDISDASGAVLLPAGAQLRKAAPAASPARQ